MAAPDDTADLLGMMRTRMQGVMEARGINQADLARRMNEAGLKTAPGTISKYLSGKMTPSLEAFSVIRRVLGVSAEELLGGADVATALASESRVDRSTADEPDRDPLGRLIESGVLFYELDAGAERELRDWVASNHGYFGMTPEVIRRKCEELSGKRRVEDKAQVRETALRAGTMMLDDPPKKR